MAGWGAAAGAASLRAACRITRPTSRHAWSRPSWLTTIERGVELVQRTVVLIEGLVDVRTAPYSRYCPQFNGPELRRAVEAAGLSYHFAGQTLGGKPADAALLGDDGKPDYDRIAATEAYQEGLGELRALAAEQ